MGPAARTAENVIAWGARYGIDSPLAGVIRQAREDVAPTIDALGRLGHVAATHSVEA